MRRIHGGARGSPGGDRPCAADQRIPPAGRARHPHGGADSVGLCAVSTGAFGYPKEEAAPLVLSVIDRWLDAHPGAGPRIVICAFSQEDVDAYEKALIPYRRC